MKLAEEEIVRRARNIRLVLTDNDGVLTDTGVYYSDKGEELKRFSIRDGMGVERLRNAGVETGIVTGEMSESVRKRARKLSITHLYLGVKNKKAKLEAILAETGLAPENIAYIGDDVNDLEIIQFVNERGLTACPSDGMPAIQSVVHYTCAIGGGHGAFRDFAEYILEKRGKEMSNV